MLSSPPPPSKTKWLFIVLSTLRYQHCGTLYCVYWRRLTNFKEENIIVDTVSTYVRIEMSAICCTYFYANRLLQISNAQTKIYIRWNDDTRFKKEFTMSQPVVPWWWANFFFWLTRWNYIYCTLSAQCPPFSSSRYS